MPLEITPEIQAELDRVAGKTREEERRKFEKELETEKKTLGSQLAEATTKLQDLEKAKATAADADKILTDLEAGLLAKIPEDKRSLVPEALSKADKVRFILKNEAHLYGTTAAAPPGAPPVTPPTTPPGGKPPVAINTGDIPGAKREVGADGEPIITITDAKAYQQWRREGNRP